MTTTHILAVGSISAGGEIDWHIAPRVEEEFQVSDLKLDSPSDYDAEQEWQDYFLDVDWLRQGC